MQNRMRGLYTLVVPALDRTGPVNVAVDIGRAACAAGWQVRMLHLGGTATRDDLGFATEVRSWRKSDLWRLRGVVHTHCLRPDLMGWLLSWNRRITLMTTVHNFFLFDVGFDKPKLYVRVAWLLWKRALARYDHVVCICEAMRRYYRRALPGQPLSMAYNFRAAPEIAVADPSVLAWIEARKRAGLTVLVFVGSLSDRKNITGLVAALADAQSLALVVCGQGPLLESLDAMLRERSLADRVLLAGQVMSPASIIRHGHALVLPSFAEGFPLAVIEAAAVGIPSLLSNIAVHRELAELGFGRVFDHRCFKDLETASLSLVAHLPAPSATMQRLWASRFTPEAGFARYEALLDASAPAR